MIFFLDTRNFPENRVVPLQSFSFQSRETKNFEKTVMPPSHGWKFSMKEFFWITKLFSNEMFWYSRTKTSRPTLIPPLLEIKYFSLPEVFWRTEWFSGEVFFGRVRETKFRQNREASPLLCFKLLAPPPLTQNFLRYGKICETKKGSPGSFSVLWDNNFCIEKLYIPLLGIKFLDTRNFLKHRWVPRRKFLPLWDEIFSRENRDTLLYKVQKSVFELMFVRAYWNLI